MDRFGYTSLKEMRAVPAEELLEKFKAEGMGLFRPHIDGILLRESFDDAARNRHLADANYMIGCTLDDLNDRWQQDVLELKPDILSVLIGTNDVADYIKHRDDPKGFDTIRWETPYRNLLSWARAINPSLKIALGTPFVSKTTPQSQQELCARLAAAVRWIAKDFNAVVMPFDDLFHELQQSHPNTRYWIWDAVHPTAAGHKRMADLWISKATEAGWLIGNNP